MSCPGLPLHSTTTQPCQKTICKDSSTNPATLTCVGSTYVFAEHYIVKGVVTKGAVGGYVPATTVCQMNIVPDHIGNANKSKAKYFGL